MDEEEPDESRRLLLKAACALPVAGGIGELLLRLFEIGSAERRVARYGARAIVTARQPEFPGERAAQALTGEQDRRGRY